MTEIDLSAVKPLYIWKEEFFYDENMMDQVIVHTPLDGNPGGKRFFICFTARVMNQDGIGFQRVGPLPVASTSLEETFKRHKEFQEEFAEKQNKKLILPGRNGIAN